jgi:hypothetical protein
MVIGGKKKDDDESSEDSEESGSAGEAKDESAGALLGAIKRGDKKAVVSALEAFIEACHGEDYEE